MDCFPDYYFSLRNVENQDERIKVIKECHKRCAQRLVDLCFANGGIYIKLGQHVGQLVRHNIGQAVLCCMLCTILAHLPNFLEVHVLYVLEHCVLSCVFAYCQISFRQSADVGFGS